MYPLQYGTLAYASVGTIKYTETNDSVQLAYSKLYSGGIFFDTNDAWSIADTTPSGEFDLFTVALHEVGHALGLLHEDDTIDGNNISIMNTYYAKSDGLLQDDIDGIQYLYGVSAVPEPSTYLLFLLGLTMLLGVSKKRRLGQAS